VFAILGVVFSPIVLAHLCQAAIAGNRHNDALSLMAQLESREPLPVVGRPCPGRSLSGLKTPLSELNAA
jgi:phosphoribosylcarboxyaminoimidazole (NCAIR) mutase